MLFCSMYSFPLSLSLSFSPAWIVEVNWRQWSKGRHLFASNPVGDFSWIAFDEPSWSLLEDEKLSPCFSKSSLIDHCPRKQLINQPLWKNVAATVCPLPGRALPSRTIPEDFFTLHSRSLKFFQRYFLEIFRFESGKFKKIEKFCWRVTSSSYYKYYQDFIMRYENKIIICLHSNDNNRKKNRYSNSVEE